MSKEITDAMLDERTTELIRQQFPEERLTWKGAHAYTRAALEVERESLRLLGEFYQRSLPSAYGGTLLAHIQVLRTRLGITE